MGLTVFMVSIFLYAGCSKQAGTAMLWSFSRESLNFFSRNGRVHE